MNNYLVSEQSSRNEILIDTLTNINTTPNQDLAQTSHQTPQVELQRLLIEMGFEVGFINKVFAYYQVNSFETAIDYMTKVDNLWSHPFVNLENEQIISPSNRDDLHINVMKPEDNFCLVCGEVSNNHRINFLKSKKRPTQMFREQLNINLDRYKPSHLEKLDSNSEYQNNVLDESETCRICLSPIENPFHYNCDHKYCKECIQEYILDKINSSDVEEISCPEGKEICSTILEGKLIKSLITGINLERYEKFSHRAKIMKIPNSVLCPLTDCDSYAINKNTHTLTCLTYNHEFCPHCLQLAHPNFTCDYKLDSEFKKWAGKEKVKKCPKCSFYIQKNEGCNHMKCANSICKYEFCWICKSKYSSSHYDNILMPCYKLQNTKQTSIIVRIPSLRYLKLLGTYLLCLILFVLGVTFSTGILVFLCTKNTSLQDRAINSVGYRNKQFMKIMTVLIIAVLTICLMPLGYIAIVLAIAFSPFFLIAVVIKCLKNKYSRS